MQHHRQQHLASSYWIRPCGPKRLQCLTCSKSSVTTIMCMEQKKNSTRAMTFLELLVAVAIALVFMGGVIAAFIQILRATNLAEVKLDAVNNARAALEMMAIDIKAAWIDPRQTLQYFLGEDHPLSYGNGLDDDQDGNVDEELFNGRDDDYTGPDWNFARDDRHATAGGVYERPFAVSGPDLGDGHVDEDCKFDLDRLIFRIFPDPNNPTSRDDLITLEVGTFEGEQHVLVRRIIHAPSSPNRSVEVEPLAFNVMSVHLLYWDPNRIPPDWTTSWNSFDAPRFVQPGIELPVAVFIAVTVYADTKPIEQYKPGDPIQTVTLQTVVNIEQVLKDQRYQTHLMTL
jgi:type II secretory pathway pseudopilin PulG